jgi:hypothetical protein
VIAISLDLGNTDEQKPSEHETECYDTSGKGDLGRQTADTLDSDTDYEAQ